MKKNGFTLVEVLVVISILAVLVLLVLPKVIDSVTGAKERNFLSESQNIYKTAKSQYLLDKAKGYYNFIYQDGESAHLLGYNVRKLDLSSRKGFGYTIVFKNDSSGEIIYFFTQDADNVIERGDNNDQDHTVEFKDINKDAMTPRTTPLENP